MGRVQSGIMVCIYYVYKVVFQSSTSKRNILLYIEEVLPVLASNRKEKVKLQILQVNTILYFLNTLPNRGEIHTKRNDYLKL